MNDNQHIPSGYKPSPLGVIPEDWEVKRLGDCFDICAGRDLITETYSPTQTVKHQYPIFSNSLENKGLYGYTSTPRHKANSITITGRGSLGHAEYRKQDFDAIIRLLVLTPKIEISCELITNYINFTQPFIYESTGVPQLTAPQIQNTKLLLPPYKEQLRIMDVLHNWDTAIEKQTALIEQLTLRKRGLMQQLLTGKKRLKGFEGEGEWKRIKAGEIFKSISVKGNGSEVLLSATQEHGVIPRDQLEGRVTMPTGDTNSFKLVEVGDFVISLRSFQGGLEYSEHRGIVSPAYTVLKPIVEIDKSFYRYYFKSAEFIGHLAIAVIGIRDGKQISYEDFCFVKIPYPNIEEQKAISTVLLQADKEIEIQKQKLAVLLEQKKGLMQVLLTGKKRIK